MSIALVAEEAAVREASSYPEPFASLMNGRQKRPLGEFWHVWGI